MSSSVAGVVSSSVAGVVTSYRRAQATGALGPIRLLLLLLAVGNLGVGLAQALGSDEPVAVRCVAVVLGIGLAVYWAIGHRREGFPLAGEPLEAAAVFLLLTVTPGEPFLPLFGLLFRSLYGGFPLAVVRYGLWVAALLGAHAPRGDAHFEADVARALGLGVVPGVLQALRAALGRLEASERRLRSLVQNSRAVVGGDLRVRWQATRSSACLVTRRPPS
jgi:uncharacterized membrane protein YphA (DoxX/SURF4 family)